MDGWDAAVVGYAAAAALCRPLTTPAAVAVLLPGLVLVVARARRPPRPADRPPRSAALAWAGVALAGAAWWLVALAWGNDRDHPTLSLLLDPVLDTYPGRLAGYLAWLGAGRWLVTR